MIKGNIHKKITFENKFARKFYCQNARLNQLRTDKKHQKKKFRQYLKKRLDKLFIMCYNIYRKIRSDKNE